MNNKKVARVAVVVMWVISTICAVAIGLSMGQRTMLAITAIDLDNIQAKLLFNRIEDERHVQTLLKNRCQKQASQFVDHKLDIDMQLLSGYAKNSKKMADAVSYINKRDPALLRSASSYSARFPNWWTEEACN